MRFQPIIDTSGHSILGHECLGEPQDRASAPVSPERWPLSDGLYFMTMPRPPVTGGLDPKRIVFQISDGDAGAMELARNCGAGVALHCTGAARDFLETIRQLRPDFVKLDANLTRNAEQPVSAFAIRKVVESADRFGLKVIANGVERLRMVENLWLLGVEIMQGDLFGPPAFRLVQMSSDLNNLASALSEEEVPHTATIAF